MAEQEKGLEWRSRVPDRSEFSDDAELAAYDEVSGFADRLRKMRVGGDGGYHESLLQIPIVAASVIKLGGAIVANVGNGETFTHADREWLDQVVAAELKTEIMQPAHVPMALAAGVRPEAIAALRSGQSDVLTEREAILAEFVREVVGGRVDNKVWSRLETILGQRGTLEYALFALHIQLNTRLMQALQTTPPPTSDEVDELLRRETERTQVPGEG